MKYHISHISKTPKKIVLGFILSYKIYSVFAYNLINDYRLQKSLLGHFFSIFRESSFSEKRKIIQVKQVATGVLWKRCS